MEISDEFQRYSQLISLIINDIIDNRKSAELFCKDPDSYLSQSKFSFYILPNDKLKLSEIDKKLLLAMTDKEVKEAIMNSDIKMFIQLCVNKGYFTDAKSI